ncbi:MAG: hypothetical protein ACKO6N_02450 [Myxococcota bacterium]
MSKKLLWLLLGIGFLLSLPYVLRGQLLPSTPQTLSPAEAADVLRISRQQLFRLLEQAEQRAPLQLGDLSLPPSLAERPLEGPIFITLHGVGFTARREPPTGMGGSLGQPLAQGLREALLQAVLQTKQKLALPAEGNRHVWTGQAPEWRQLRVQLDLAGTPRAFPLPEQVLPLFFNPGVDGLMTTPAGAERWQLPSRSAQRGWKLAESVRRAREGDAQAPLARFRTQAWVEAATPEKAPHLLRRGQLMAEPITSENLRSSLRDAGFYLARMVQADGRYCYTYLADQDRCDRDYNLLRHAGTTYSLYQIYREIPEPAFLQAAEQATAWLRLQERIVEGHHDQRYLIEGKLAKLGAVGLSLLALVERENAVRDGLDRERMRAYARFIRSQQRADGYLFSWFQWDRRIPVPESNSIYYPGEALLGLVRLQQLEPSAEVLETALRAADYLAFRRWRFGGIELYVPSDAWLTQALAELQQLQPHDALRAYVYELVDLTRQSQLLAEEGTPPELVGGPASGFFVPAVTPAGSRSEGLSAACKMARALGDHVQAQLLLDALMRQAPFQLWHQLREENSFFLPNPSRAHGGFRASADQLDIRIDYVQHNVTGLLGLLQLLEQPKGGQP